MLKITTSLHPRLNLEKLVLQSHVVLRLETNTSAEDVDQRTTLLRKSIDDWSSWWSQRSLEHVAEDTEDAVEFGVVIGGSTIGGRSLPLDTSHHLSEDDKINDQWGSEERVLADIEEPW